MAFNAFWKRALPIFIEQQEIPKEMMPIADLLWLARTEVSNLWQPTSGMNNRAQPETQHLFKHLKKHMHKRK